MESRRQTIIVSISAGLLALAFGYTAATGAASLAALFVGAALVVLFVFALIPCVGACESELISGAALDYASPLGARSLRRAMRHPWARIIAFAIITRVAIYIAAYAAYSIANGGYQGGIFDTLRTVWLRSDSPSYLGIAENWYVTEGDPRFHIVFFPLYPLAIRLFNFITNDSFASAMIVSNLCTLVSAVLIYELASLDMDKDSALRAVKYALIAPAAFFLAAPMTESLFLMLCVLSVYLIRKRRWLFGVLAAALAAFTRSLGAILLVYAAFEWLLDFVSWYRAGKVRQELKKHILSGLTLLVIPLGLLGYLLINYLVTGDALTFMTYQREHWSQGFGFFFESAATQLDSLITAVAKGEWNVALGLWAPNLIATFFSLALPVIAAKRGKRLRASYQLFFIAYFAVACGATWLLSSPRYLMAAFPLPIMAALIAEGRKRDIAYTVLSIVFGLAYLAFYANGQFVY